MMESFTTRFAASCSSANFLGLPTWYHYLPCQTVNGLQSPELTNINDIWLVLAAIIEILLRIGVLAAVIFVIYGGVQYTMSKGEPDKTTKARMTIINAVAGLAISVLAATVVSFIAGKFN
jgi:hypothetical protein